MKEAEKNTELIELLRTLGGKLTAGPGCYGPAAAGTTKQESGTNIILIGWDTVKVSIRSVHGPWKVAEESRLDLDARRCCGGRSWYRKTLGTLGSGGYTRGFEAILIRLARLGSGLAFNVTMEYDSHPIRGVK